MYFEKYRISISFTASFKQKVKFIMKNGMHNVNNNKYEEWLSNYLHLYDNTQLTRESL